MSHILQTGADIYISNSVLLFWKSRFIQSVYVCCTLGHGRKVLCPCRLLFKEEQTYVLCFCLLLLLWKSSFIQSWYFCCTKGVGEEAMSMPRTVNTGRDIFACVCMLWLLWRVISQRLCMFAVWRVLGSVVEEPFHSLCMSAWKVLGSVVEEPFHSLCMFAVWKVLGSVVEEPFHRVCVCLLYEGSWGQAEWDSVSPSQAVRARQPYGIHSERRVGKQVITHVFLSC